MAPARAVSAGAQATVIPWLPSRSIFAVLRRISGYVPLRLGEVTVSVGVVVMRTRICGPVAARVPWQKDSTSVACVSPRAVITAATGTTSPRKASFKKSSVWEERNSSECAGGVAGLAMSYRRRRRRRRRRCRRHSRGVCHCYSRRCWQCCCCCCSHGGPIVPASNCSLGAAESRGSWPGEGNDDDDDDGPER